MQLKWRKFIKINYKERMIQQIKDILPNTLKRSIIRTFSNIRDTFFYRRYVGNALEIGKIRHIVFVCKGNICRSAFAEHYLRSRIESDLIIESCGLNVEQGSQVPPLEAIRSAERLGIDLQLHRSKPLVACDLAGSDLILAMEFNQYIYLINRYPKNKDKIRLLRDFASGFSRIFCNIDDPYGLALKDFNGCFKLIQDALDRLQEFVAIPNE
jgi:protein-tyrosine phosphatase